MLAGITRSFEKFAKRPNRFRKINGLAYCSQEVLRAAQEASEGATQSPGADAATRDIGSPFSREEIVKYFSRNQEALLRAAEKAQEGGEQVLANDLRAAAKTLADAPVAEGESAGLDFESLERHLTALEEKLGAALLRSASVDRLAELRAEVERGLRVDRRKMTAQQIESLERQYVKKRLFEQYGVPRLSLFYL